MKIEQAIVETTPNAKAKGGAVQVSGTETGHRPSIPGAKAKAVGVPRFGQVSCSFFLQGRCSKGEACMFSHATPQAELKQSEGQPTSAERGRSSSAVRGKRSSSKPKDMHCFRFLKGICDAGDSCRWVHLTAEELKAKGVQPKAKAASPTMVEAPPEVALPCVMLEWDTDQDGEHHVAGVCPEVCAILMDGDDRIIIGRRHSKSKISAPRNLPMPDEFTESRTKDEQKSRGKPRPEKIVSRPKSRKDTSTLPTSTSDLSWTGRLLCGRQSYWRKT